MSTLQSMGLSLRDLIQMAFDSGYDAAWEHSGEGFNGEYCRQSLPEWTKDRNNKFTEFLMILGLDELKVN